MAESHLPLATIKPYARAFRRIVSDIAGIRPAKKRFDYRTGGNAAWIEKIDAVLLADVTPQKVSDWQKKLIAKAGNDVIARRRASITVNSYLRQSKALFSRKTVLDRLASIELPAVPFDGVRVERRSDTKFYGCGVEPHQLLRDAIAELAERPEELKTFYSHWCGLRRKKVDMLEWDSFDFDAGTLHIRPTQWYQLKTNESAAVLPIDAEVMELFRGWRARATGQFVIESGRQPKNVNYQWYRCEETFKALLEWLRLKGVTGNKPLHALRKLYGNVLAGLHGIHAASSGLRHADIRTTSEF